MHHRPPPLPATDRATRDARDKHAPMGRAARDVDGRMIASAGLMTEAKPVFAAPAHAVAHGGVLGALPMPLRAGLLGAANRLFRLPNGFYGLTTILLFVAFMTLARVRNPESLRYQAPGEWGAILDPCPETKTLRGKIRLLTSTEHAVRDWQSATGTHLGHRARRAPRTGSSDRGRAHRTGHGPRARTSAGCATSRPTPSPGINSRVGHTWKATWCGGCGRSPTGAGTAQRARRRSHASSVRRSGFAACAGRPPFGQLRDLIRVVHADCSVTVGTNAYSVPWRLIGARVRVVVSGSRVRVYHDREVVAEHDEHHGRHGRITDRTHLEGINTGPHQSDVADEDADEPSLLRPLAEYAAVAGGSF